MNVYHEILYLELKDIASKQDKVATEYKAERFVRLAERELV